MTKKSKITLEKERLMAEVLGKKRYDNFDIKTFEEEIKKDYGVIYEEKPKVEDSIALVRSVINYDKLTVSERCVHTLQEFATYRYPSEEERLKATVQADLPIKMNDDCMDSLRYGLFKHLTSYNRDFNVNNV